MADGSADETDADVAVEEPPSLDAVAPLALPGADAGVAPPCAGSVPLPAGCEAVAVAEAMARSTAAASATAQTTTCVRNEIIFSLSA
jgi:hypothetical protein